MNSNAAVDFQALLQQLEKKHHRVEQELQNMVKAQEKLYQFQERIEQQKTIYAQIAEAGHQFNQSLNDEEVFKAVARICVDLLNFEKFALLVPNPSGKNLTVRIHGGYHFESDEKHMNELKINEDNPLLAPFVQGQTKWLAHVSDQDAMASGWKEMFKVQELCVYNLGSSEGQLKGLLMIGNTLPHRSFHRTLTEEQELDALMGNVTSLIAGTQTAVQFMQTIQSESAQVHRLLDNMKQAVFTVDSSGKINEPVSRQTFEIFKADLVGASVYDTVFKDLPPNGEIRSRLDAAMATVFGESDLQWMLMSDQFPTEFIYRLNSGNDSELRVLRSTVQPIWDENETLEKVMFVMEDVTEIQKLEKQIEQEKFEVSVIRQILKNDLENVRSFFNQSADFLWKSLLMLETHQLEAQAFSELLRTLHTLKGNSRLFGFIEISKAIHEAESALIENKAELLETVNLGSSLPYLRVVEHFGSIATMIGDHIAVAEKVFRLQTDFKTFIFRFLALIFDRQFQEPGLHVKLLMTLLEPLTTGADRAWIEDFQQKWEDLNSALTKNRVEVFRTALNHLRPLALRSFFHSGFQLVPPKAVLELLSRLNPADTAHEEVVSEDLQLAAARLDPFLCRVPLKRKELLAYLLLAASAEWTHQQRASPASVTAADLRAAIEKMNVDPLQVAGEMDRDWNEVFDALVIGPRMPFSLPMIETWIQNFLKTPESAPLPLCRLFSFARALSPLLRHSEISLSASQGTIEVSDINLRRLQRSVQSLQARFSSDPEVRNLLNSFQRLADVPLKPFLVKFEAMVSEVSSSLQKKVHFSVRGDDVSVPRELLSHLQDIIVQLLRNAIDHGLETAADRSLQNKPEYGTLEITCFEKNSTLEIRVRDDGRGINPEHLAELSVRKGLLTAEQAKALSNEDKLNLIFRSGFSSKEEATDFSGRGVGMDIVKSTIESLNGKIVLQSAMGRGTEFELSLPLHFTSREI